jgi:citrate lyase subunit beta/citryl-CoA lyase
MDFALRARLAAMGTQPRSYLFVPGTRIDRVDKALTGAADEIIVDLEDGVGMDDKDRARDALGSWISTRPYLVRVNALGTSMFADDVVAVAELAHVAGVILPKAERPDELATLRSRLPARVELYALIESAAGILAAPEIARSGVRRLMFGSADYLAALGVSPSREVFAFPRASLVVASAAAGIAPPVDGPTLRFDDPTAVESDARDAKALGCGAKMCIHPSQVDVVNDVFAPTVEELAWARRVVEHAESSEDGATALEGVMIDAPVLTRAKRLLGL